MNCCLGAVCCEFFKTPNRVWTVCCEPFHAIFKLRNLDDTYFLHFNAVECNNIFTSTFCVPKCGRQSIYLMSVTDCIINCRIWWRTFQAKCTSCRMNTGDGEKISCRIRKDDLQCFISFRCAIGDKKTRKCILIDRLIQSIALKSIRKTTF